MCFCECCGGPVDTDDDPEAIFDTDTQLDVCLCESCRESPAINLQNIHYENEADIERKSA